MGGRPRAIGDSGGDELVVNIETGRIGRGQDSDRAQHHQGDHKVSDAADAAFSAECPMRRGLRRFMSGPG
jgi:hypothetical protein